MTLLTKLLALFQSKPAPAPTPVIADTEFLEAVAKTWRERYQPQPAPPATKHGQAA